MEERGLYTRRYQVRIINQGSFIGLMACSQQLPLEVIGHSQVWSTEKTRWVGSPGLDVAPSPRPLAQTSRDRQRSTNSRPTVNREANSRAKTLCSRQQSTNSQLKIR